MKSTTALKEWFFKSTNIDTVAALDDVFTYIRLSGIDEVVGRDRLVFNMEFGVVQLNLDTQTALLNWGAESIYRLPSHQIHELRNLAERYMGVLSEIRKVYADLDPRDWVNALGYPSALQPYSAWVVAEYWDRLSDDNLRLMVNRWSMIHSHMRPLSDAAKAYRESRSQHPLKDGLPDEYLIAALTDEIYGIDNAEFHRSILDRLKQLSALMGQSPVPTSLSSIEGSIGMLRSGGLVLCLSNPQTEPFTGKILHLERHKVATGNGPEEIVHGTLVPSLRVYADEVAWCYIQLMEDIEAAIEEAVRSNINVEGDISRHKLDILIRRVHVLKEQLIALGRYPNEEGEIVSRVFKEFFPNVS